MMKLVVIGFIASLLLALLITPWVKRISLWFGSVAVPNHRSMHRTVMPQMGGLAMFISFVAVFAAMAPFVELPIKPFVGIVLGAAVVELVGVLDDRFALKPSRKLLGQMVAAGIVVLFDVRIEVFTNPFGSSWFGLEGWTEWLAVPLTVVWIVGVSNAMNYIDGLDGLAAGVSAIATGSILVMALFMGNWVVVLVCAILLGSILGFLPFNFYPAKLFMGDSGSLFLGFMLASLSVFGFKQITLLSFIAPMVILGVPLSDTLLATIRRWMNKVPIFRADKGHIHHNLMNLGFSMRSTVLIMYAVALFFGVSAIVLAKAPLIGKLLILLLVVLVVQAGAELVGAVKGGKPVLNMLLRLFGRSKPHGGS
ncbi:MraY family glycosyltransferase [Paenibacillus sp. y28]|uniref:MraY family glycosyltransferase n=1 Tax=Paenibacillus sp. y28 TaxID=3129110 RepID=UPI0030161662